eukprot:jgi/Hompol1/3930/HPOL_006826-RA
MQLTTTLDSHQIWTDSTTHFKPSRPQPYDVYLVCDIEATCIETSSFDFENEIIEFPVIAISGATMETIDVFHRYVRPQLRPILSDFCKNLTGITQEQVDSAKPFKVVFGEFNRWIQEIVPDGGRAVFVTDGPWDLRDFIEKEFVYNNIGRPHFMRRIVDIRKIFT